MNWIPPTVQRQDALASYLTKLGLDYSEAPVLREIPDALTLEGHTIRLDPWERTLLQESLGGHSSESQPWAPLLAEGLAFQMKCLARLEPPIRDDGNPVLPGRMNLERLIVDAAVGLALLQETQRAIDQMVVAGEIAEAKRLTVFRNKIGQTVARLKDEIGEDQFPRAENKAEGMVAPASRQRTLISRSTGPDPAGGGQTWNGRRPIAEEHLCAAIAVDAPEERTNRLGPLTTLLIVLTVIWGVFILPKLSEPKPHILQSAEFTDVPGIVSTVAKPPSVYITVESAVWTDLETPDRKAMIVDIGKVAEEQGYIGADIRDNQGAVIGRWLKARGASLIE